MYDFYPCAWRNVVIIIRLTACMYKCTRKNSIVEKRRGSWWNLSCSYHVSGVGNYSSSSTAACAAARRAMGTRKGEQLA